jgi:hypothetical protein
MGHAKFYIRSGDAVIRVYGDAGNVIETHEHKGDFKEWLILLASMLLLPLKGQPWNLGFRFRRGKRKPARI